VSKGRSVGDDKTNAFGEDGGMPGAVGGAVDEMHWGKIRVVTIVRANARYASGKPE
jgi:hypothetical protein